jgi:hypothetical protein
MNRLNQTKPAILPYFAFFGDSVFSYFVGRCTVTWVRISTGHFRDIFSTVIRTVPLLLHVQKIIWDIEGKLFYSLQRNNAVAGLCSCNFKVVTDQTGHSFCRCVGSIATAVEYSSQKRWIKYGRLQLSISMWLNFVLCFNVLLETLSETGEHICTLSTCYTLVPVSLSVSSKTLKHKTKFSHILIYHCGRLLGQVVMVFHFESLAPRRSSPPFWNSFLLSCDL